MKICASVQLLITLILTIGVTMIHSFTIITTTTSKVTKLNAAPETVEVCGFKDCKRAGGGPKLEKLVNSIVEEKGLVDVIKVEGCECQVSNNCIHNKKNEMYFFIVLYFC